MVALSDDRRRGPERMTRARPPAMRLRVVEPPAARVREDALPEHTDYRDTGCELSPSCLRCPLARCKYDEPSKRGRGNANARRDREIALLRRRHHAPIDLLARTYGVSRRTIFRILRDAR
ncbi:MAG TPA: hypothetical protein VFC53_12455 [Dehalococcoidia bacterium]|nr:hypothetical protein [Dehalococcoidia bacterium]